MEQHETCNPHVVVDIQLGERTAATSCAPPQPPVRVATRTDICCCGHGVVCAGCMALAHHGYGCCAPADGRHPSVVLGAPVWPTKDGDHGDDATAHLDDHWQQREASRTGGDKKRPHYVVWIYFVFLFGASIALGAVLGSSFAEDMKGKGMKVLGYVLGMCVIVPVASLIWCPLVCCDPDDSCFGELR